MSKITLEEFLNNIKNDAQLKSKLNAALREADTSKIVSIAKEAGYTIKEEDISSGNLGASENTFFELDDATLEKLSGGDRSGNECRIIETVNYGECGGGGSPPGGG